MIAMAELCLLSRGLRRIDFEAFDRVTRRHLSCGPNYATDVFAVFQRDPLGYLVSRESVVYAQALVDYAVAMATSASQVL